MKALCPLTGLTIHGLRSTYKHILVSKCAEIIEQCSKQDFHSCNTIYCEAVEETCKRFLQRIKGNEEQEEEDIPWPRNIEWFCPEDYLFSFIDLLIIKAGKHSPEDGKCVALQTFIEREQPISESVYL